VNVEDQLRWFLAEAVRAGRTEFSVARAAGLKPEVVYRFSRGLGLHSGSVAKLAKALGLTLVRAEPVQGSPGGGPQLIEG